MALSAQTVAARSLFFTSDILLTFGFSTKVNIGLVNDDEIRVIVAQVPGLIGIGNGEAEIRGQFAETGDIRGIEKGRIRPQTGYRTALC